MHYQRGHRRPVSPLHRRVSGGNVVRIINDEATGKGSVIPKG
jgi:hypothetical protein